MIDIENLRLLYFQNDESVPYKLKCGYELKISPIKVKDWSIFESSLGVLQIEKNEINDIRIIQMSYLEFLVNVIIPSNEGYASALFNIFNYSMGENHISVGKNKGKDCIILTDEKDIIKAFITSKEFDEISKIILFQNMKDYDDRYLSPDVKEAIQDYFSLRNKESYNPTLEQKKTYTIAKTGILMKDINEMTYRTFEQVYNSCIDTDIYFGQKIIQASYKYKVDDDVKYPMFEKKKDILDQVFSTSDEQMVNKINQVNG